MQIDRWGDNKKVHTIFRNFSFSWLSDNSTNLYITYSELLKRPVELAYLISDVLAERQLSTGIEKLGVWFILHAWLILHQE